MGSGKQRFGLPRVCLIMVSGNKPPASRPAGSSRIKRRNSGFRISLACSRGAVKTGIFLARGRRRRDLSQTGKGSAKCQNTQKAGGSFHCDLPKVMSAERSPRI